MGLPARFGPYVLLEKLGEGAQGDVHVARRAEGGRGLFVLKRLTPRFSDNDDFVRRFRHEAVIATSVDSPHVVKIFDVGRVGDRLYLVMELVSGWPLSQVIGELRKRRLKAPIDVAVEVVLGALSGLGAMHRALAPDGSSLGIVHRDAAPKNLMLSSGGVVKVIDLGLGRSNRLYC
jgi:serine/threonine-protein kinase